VKKGDAVEKDQIVVRLEDAEQRANVATAEGRLAAAQVALERAELAYRRIHDLYRNKVVSDDSEDEARLAVAAAQATLREIEGQLSLARTNLEWTVIRSPISGVVLEKLAEPGELVTPQSFGGTRGPSTAVFAVADPRDLQVELDINESDLAKIALGDKCRVIPEAYPDLRFDGVVAEISPEANRRRARFRSRSASSIPTATSRLSSPPKSSFCTERCRCGCRRRGGVLRGLLDRAAQQADYSALSVSRNLRAHAACAALLP
jgi:HlyD family secretion protein